MQFIFETHKSNMEMIYTLKYHVIYFIDFVYGAWMWVGALAEVVTLEGGISSLCSF